MNLKQWCNEERGRKTALAAHLGVSLSSISQALSGDIRIPPDWYRPIVAFTEGAVTLDDLTPEGRA